MLTQVGGRQETPAYVLSTLSPGHIISGPAVLIDNISTVLVEPQCVAHITAGADIRIDLESSSAEISETATECDPIQLAIFSHR